MDDSTANLVVFIGFVVIMIFSVMKIIFSSDEENQEKVREANARRSNAIKRGIQYSKIYGTKKSRKNRY